MTAAENKSTNRSRIIIGFLPAILTPAIEIVLFRRLGEGHPLAMLFGLLVLTVMAVMTWITWRLGWRAVGLRIGRPRYAAVAFLYPLAVLLPLVLIAVVAGQTAVDPAGAAKIARRLGITFVGTLIGVFLTEEGFFRGALFGGLRAAGRSPGRTVVWTTLAFAAWHVYVPLVEKDLMLPGAQIPVYYTNVLLLGGLWGLARAVSGSMLIPCVAHASWNALVYTMFGYGEKTGALGIENTWLFGPERGLLGVLVNGVALWWLYRVFVARTRAGAVE